MTQRIIRFETSNFKNIEAISMELKGKSLVVSGRNAQGKSSLLDAIEFALVGKRAVDNPIRAGEQETTTLMETDDLLIKRKLTASGSHVLKVMNKEKNAEYKSPQAFLDGFYTQIGLEPKKFMSLSAMEQAEAILKAVGKLAEYNELQGKYDDAYSSRRETNRDYKSLKSTIDETVKDKNLDDIDSGFLKKKIKEVEGLIKQTKQTAREKQDTLYEKKNELNKELDMQSGLPEEIEQHEEAIDKNNIDIKALKEQIKKLQGFNKAHKTAIKELKEESKTLDPDGLQAEVDELQEQIDNLDYAAKEEELIDMKSKLSLIEQVEQQEERAYILKQEADKAERILEGAKTALTKITNDTLKAKYPEIKGLTIQNKKVFVNDIPLTEMSTSEQLQIATKIMNKYAENNNIIILRDGNDLDTKTLKELIAYAEDKGKQIIIERITSPEDMEDMTIEIIEGRIN